MDQSEAKEDKSGTPSIGELKREVEDILPFVQSEADEAEQLYHLTDRLVAEFRRRGLYTVITPKAIGGVELPYVEAMELVERVSWADASTGWCMMVLGVQHGSAGTFISDEGVREIYPDGADVTMAGQGVPRGYARRVDGGFVIRGLWGYGSAIYHAEWVHSGCFLMDGDDMKLNDDGSPVVVIAHHPRDSIELKGNWDTLGLRGTGSFDYTIKGGEVFVPDRRCHWLDNPAQHRGGTQYSSGITGLATWGHTSWASGAAPSMSWPSMRAAASMRSASSLTARASSSRSRTPRRSSGRRAPSSTAHGAISVRVTQRANAGATSRSL